MTGQDKIRVPPGDPGTGQELHVYDAKARSCPECHSIGDPKGGCIHPWHQLGIHPVLDHQFTLPTGRDWAGGLCELHCREDRCCYGCDCPGHQPDGTHIVQTNSHEGMHGWLEHDGHPLHQHNPVTHSIRWATKEEIERRGAVQCGRWGCALPAGHNVGQADIRENHKTTHELREGRCPDGGYCHGSTLAAGSGPCEPGHCLRVQTSGPLSGVFPGDRWPEEVKTASMTLQLEAALTKPDGSPMVAAIHINSEVMRHLQAAMGSRDLREAQAELAMAAALIESLDDNIVTAQYNIGDALREAPQPPPE